MSDDLRDLLGRGAAMPSSDVDVDTLVRAARGRRRRRVRTIAGAVAAVMAVVVAGVVVVAQPSSDLSIASRGAASSTAPNGWTLVTHDDLRLAIPPEWTELDSLPDEAITVGTSAFPRTGAIIPCDFPGAQIPATAGTWVTVFQYRDLQRNDEVPTQLVPALRTTGGWVEDRPHDLRAAVVSIGSCGGGTPQGLAPPTPPAPGRYEVVTFRDAGRVFVALLAAYLAPDDAAFDLAYRVLDTLRVGGAASAPDPTTADTAPTTSTTLANSPTAPPVTAPVATPNAADDEAAVRDVFLAWIDAQPKGALDEIVEDFASIRDVHQQGMDQHTAADLATYSGRVDSITIIDATHAEVRYSILHGGRVDFSMLPGRAIKMDGRWMVTRETVCNLLTYGGLTCPPRAPGPDLSPEQ